MWYEGSGTTAKNWIYTNHLGSVVALANTTGTSTATYTYGPFGEPNTTAGNMRFRYTGQQLIPALNLYYYKARFYSPTLGRFLQTDPIGQKDDMNLYAYVKNNAINSIDPTGMFESKMLMDLDYAKQPFSYDSLMAGGAQYYDVGSGKMVTEPGLIYIAPEEYFISPLRLGTKVASMAKTGPKTDPNAPHNAKIRELGNKVEADGGVIIAGGGKLNEKLVPTTGGYKDGRRPDIMYKDSNGVTKAINVGKAKQDGTPIKREKEALADLNGKAKIPTIFERYN